MTITLDATSPKALLDLAADFSAGRKAALARAVSIVENQRVGRDELLAAMHPHIGRARRIGLTGPPGAGKSTLTTLLAAEFRKVGLTVGIVAVDPTSPFTGGALLGDRVRMELIALDPGVFIRSMATRGSLGGLAGTTREVCDVLDAFGVDRILVETVGVGQSELDIARTVDSSVVVLVPESGHRRTRGRCRNSGRCSWHGRCAGSHSARGESACESADNASPRRAARQCRG